MSTHTDTEKLRLDTGLENCGCPECQSFYKTLDLSKYRGRVKTYGDVIIITAKRDKNSTSPGQVPENTAGETLENAVDKQQGLKTPNAITSGGRMTPTGENKGLFLHPGKSGDILSCENDSILTKRGFQPSFRKKFPPQKEMLPL